MSPSTGTPVNSVWFVMGSSMLIGLLGFFEAAFASMAGLVYGFISFNYFELTLKRQGIGNRAVHVVRYPHCLAHHLREETVRSRPLQSRKMGDTDRDDCHGLGFIHLCNLGLPRWS